MKKATRTGGSLALGWVKPEPSAKQLKWVLARTAPLALAPQLRWSLPSTASRCCNFPKGLSLLFGFTQAA